MSPGLLAPGSAHQQNKTRGGCGAYTLENTALTSEAVLGYHAPETTSTHHSSLAGPQHADPQDELGLTPSPSAQAYTSFELPSFAP